jgi:hypothetical protein
MQESPSSPATSTTEYLVFMHGDGAQSYTLNQRGRFVQHRITTKNFDSAGRIGDFAKYDGRDDGKAEDEAERELRGLHFQVTIPREFLQEFYQRRV